MKNRTLLLLIAVIMVGLFALPNALSLFAGQHSFDKAGNGTICSKCHSDVADELRASAYHKSISTNSSGMCIACHSAGRIDAGLIPLGNGTGKNGTSGVMVGLNISAGTFYYANGSTNSSLVLHSAVTIECVSCHYAVNFTNDAHKQFATDANNQSWLKGGNEACVGCHTKTYVNMTWIRKGGYNYQYDFQNSTGTLSFNGTNVTTYTNNTG